MCSPLIGGTIFYAQQQKILITGSYKDVALVSILNSYKKKYGIEFAYDSDLLKKQSVSGEFNQMPIKEVLQHLLQQRSLTSEWLGEICIIKTVAGSKNFSLTGVILDSESEEPLPYVNVYVAGSKKGVTSSSDGTFTLPNIPTDTSLLMANYLGYRQTQFRVSELNPTSKVKITMQNRPEVLQEIIIKEDSSILQFQNAISQITMKPAKLSILPNLGEQDAFRALQLLPGISGTYETASGLVIRDSPPDQVLVILDGFSLYNLNHFYGLFSAVNSNAIKDIEVSKSGFQPKYGGYVGGIVNITGSSGNKRKNVRKIGVSMISSNIVYEAPLGSRASILLAGRRSYTDVLESKLYKNLFDHIAPVTQSDLSIENTIDPDFYFYDFNGKITYNPSHRDILSMSVYLAKDQLDIFSKQVLLGVTFVNKDDISWGHNGYGLQWVRQWRKKYITNFQIGYSSYSTKLFGHVEGKYNSGLATERDVFLETSFQKHNVKDIKIKFNNEWEIASNHNLSYGAEVTKNEVNLSLILSQSDFQNKDTGVQLATYLQDKIQLSKKFSVLFGARVMYYSGLLSEVFLEPKTTLAYQVNNQIKLKGGWGINNQVISQALGQYVYKNLPPFWVLAGTFNPSISSVNNAIGISYEKNNFLVDIEFYNRKSKGIIEYVLELTNLNPNGVFTPDRSYIGTNSAYGLEVLLQKKTGIHSWWLSYALKKSENKFKEINRGHSFPSQYDQRHELKIVNLFEVRKWEFSANWIYGSGKPFTPIDKKMPEDTSPFDYQNINSSRLPAYHRFDISATYNFKMGNTKAQVGGSIFNLYNRKNIKHKNFTIYHDDVPPQVEYYELRDVKSLGFTPNIQFNIQF